MLYNRLYFYVHGKFHVVNHLCDRNSKQNDFAVKACFGVAIYLRLGNTSKNGVAEMRTRLICTVQGIRGNMLYLGLFLSTANYRGEKRYSVIIMYMYACTHKFMLAYLEW